MYRRTAAGTEVFLVHPGGPYFRSKDLGCWTIPKGEIEAGEDPLAVARREFEEETGLPPSRCARSAAEPAPLGSVRQSGGKVVTAWAFEGDWPGGALRSNRFAIEWPPRSGRRAEFPEVDRGEFFDVEAARRKINPAQAVLLDRLLERLAGE